LFEVKDPPKLLLFQEELFQESQELGYHEREVLHGPSGRRRKLGRKVMLLLLFEGEETLYR